MQKLAKEKREANAFMLVGNINQRQSLALQRLKEKSDANFTIKELQNQFSISLVMARKDLSDFVQQNY